MQGLVDKNILNSLKLRASYGETGQDGGIASFSYLTSYGFNSTAYVVNGAYVPGFTEGAMPSPDLTWYTTKQFDLGFDFASLNSRLYGSFDYFFYSTKGYLQTPTGVTYLNTALGLTFFASFTKGSIPSRSGATAQTFAYSPAASKIS